MSTNNIEFEKCAEKEYPDYVCRMPYYVCLKKAKIELPFMCRNVLPSQKCFTMSHFATYNSNGNHRQGDYEVSIDMNHRRNLHNENKNFNSFAMAHLNV